MNRFRILIGALAVMGVAAADAASAQTRATVSGTVRDSSAAVLPGVTITVSSPVLVGGDQTMATTATGEYRFSELLPGVYEVRAALQGFQTVRHQDIRIEFGTTVTIDFMLNVSSVVETVVVRGQSPAVDVKTAAAPNTLSSEQLEALPLLSDRRQSSDVINLAPGTTLNSAYGGARQSANNLMLDGQTVNLPQSAGVNSSFINNNWLEEIQIVGLGANAEYGEFSGIGANMVLRSGSNRVSGLAEYMFGPDRWVADNRQSLSDALRAKFAPQKLLTNLDSTVQLGGPLRKDRVFFFAGFEYYHKSQLPAGALGNVPADERWPRWVGKINWAAAPTLRFEGALEADRDNLSGNGAGSTNAPEALSVNQAPKVLWNTRLTWTPSGRTLVEFRHGGLGYEQRIFPTPPGSIDGPAPHKDSNGITSVNVFSFRQLDEKRLLTAGSLTRFADNVAGKTHRFKVGVEYERTEDKLYIGAPGGLQFNDRNGQPDQVTIWAGDRTDGVGHRTSLYAQDTWELNSRVTIEPGLRVSFNRGSVPDRGTVFKTNPVSPRLGFAWDLAADHKTVARVSWGRYHDPNFTTFYEFMNTATETVRIAAKVLGPNNYQELQRITPATNFGIDPNITHSYTDHYVAGIERELFTDFSLNLQYIGMRFANIMAFRDTGSIYVPAIAPVPWPDGKPATAGDGGLITVYSLTNPGQAFLQLTNPPGAYRDYNAFQVIAKKRYSHNWQAQLSWTYSKTFGSVNNAINENTGTGVDTGMMGEFVNPNKAINSTGPGSLAFPNQVNLNGTYRLPFWSGVNFSGVFHYNTGAPWGRTAVISAASASPTLKQGSETVRIEVRGTRFTDPLHQLDLRIQKTFHFSILRPSVYADIYNVSNQGVVGGLMAVTEASGANLGVPVVWSNPRTLQMGVRLTF